MERYRGFLITMDFVNGKTWTAQVTAPDELTPHPVVLRASETEGQATVLLRAKLLIDTLLFKK